MQEQTTPLLDVDLPMQIDDEVDDNQDWLESYKSEQQNYHNFYTEEVTSVEIYYLFVNVNNELENVTTNVMELPTPGKLLRENLRTCILEQQQNQLLLLQQL